MNKVSCSKCGYTILADTEDWENPLCYEHYCEFLGEHQKQINKLQAKIELLEECRTKFLSHYDSRKITNGFHDLLASEFRKTGEKIKAIDNI